MSAELGVSRTPVREALLQLEREGIVRSVPAKGFVVAPLSVEEVDDIFPMVSACTGWQLGERVRPTAAQVQLLRAVNMNIRMGADPAGVFVQDLNWHKLLLARCPNKRLLDLIDVMYDATRVRPCVFREAGDARVSAKGLGGFWIFLVVGMLMGRRRCSMPTGRGSRSRCGSGFAKRRASHDLLDGTFVMVGKGAVIAVLVGGDYGRHRTLIRGSAAQIRSLVQSVVGCFAS